jgi:glutathione S-transferase
MPALQVIGAPPSTFTRVVRMAAIEKGIPFEFTPAAPHSPEVKAIHPAGKVPVMRHGDVTIFESRAIVHYIDDHFDGPPLTPRDKRGDAEVEQWVSYFNTVSDPLLIRRYLFGYLFPKTADKKPDRAAIDAMKPDLAREFEVLDRAVAKTGHVVGDRFTLADMYLMPMLAYARQPPEGAELMGKSKNLSAYFDRHAARESFKQTTPPPRN